jgi:mRNA-degrading endonuclease toxin of MazEF toxin-antitoxin module
VAPFVCSGQKFNILATPSRVICDNLKSLRKTDLTHFLGSLSRSKLADLNKSLIMALDLF